MYFGMTMKFYFLLLLVVIFFVAREAQSALDCGRGDVRNSIVPYSFPDSRWTANDKPVVGSNVRFFASAKTYADDIIMPMKSDELNDLELYRHEIRWDDKVSQLYDRLVGQDRPSEMVVGFLAACEAEKKAVSDSDKPLVSGLTSPDINMGEFALKQEWYLAGIKDPNSYRALVEIPYKPLDPADKLEINMDTPLLFEAAIENNTEKIKFLLECKTNPLCKVFYRYACYLRNPDEREAELEDTKRRFKKRKMLIVFKYPCLGYETFVDFLVSFKELTKADVTKDIKHFIWDTSDKSKTAFKDHNNYLEKHFSMREEVRKYFFSEYFARLIEDIKNKRATLTQEEQKELILKLKNPDGKLNSVYDRYVMQLFTHNPLLLFDKSFIHQLKKLTSENKRDKEEHLKTMTDIERLANDTQNSLFVDTPLVHDISQRVLEYSGHVSLVP